MKSNQNLRNTVITLLFASLAVPLIFSQSFFFPFISAKGFAFRILIEIAFALYIILALRDRSYLPKKSLIAWSVAVFLVIMAAATVHSIYPYKSFWSNYERMEGYITLLHLGAYFVMMSTVFNTKKLWVTFLNSSLVMSLLMGFVGLKDLGNNISRIYGTLGNSSYLGVYALIHIFIAGYFLIKLLEHGKRNDETFGWKIFFYGFVGLFNVLVMYFTGTRGSFVGLVAGSVVIALILALFEKEKKYIRNIGFAGLGLIILVVISLSALHGSQFSKNHPKLSIDRYASLITFDVGKVLRDQGYGRTLLWDVAWEGVKEKPVLGWGQDNFGYVFAKHYNPEMYGQEQWFDRAHNVFLDWLVAGGILGLLSYLAMSILFLWSLLTLPEDRMGRGEKAMLTGLVIAYAVHNFFVFDNLVSYLLFFALLAYVQTLATLSVSIKHTQKNHHVLPLIKHTNGQYAVGALVAIAMISVIYIATIKPLFANTTLINALFYQAEYTSQGSGRTGNKQALIDALDAYKKALAYKSFGTSEVREQLALAAQDVFNGDPSVQKDALVLAYNEMSAQTKQTPHDPRPWYFLASLFARQGLYEQSLAPTRAAQMLSPTKQAFMFLEGEALVNLKKYDEAVVVFKKAYDEAPGFDQAQVLMVIGSLYANKTDTAFELIAKHQNVLSDQRVLQALVLSKKIGRAAPLLEALIKDDKAKNIQTDSNVYVFLAEGYLQNGERAKALAILQALKVLTTNKDALTQIEGFIERVNKGGTSLVD